MESRLVPGALVATFDPEIVEELKLVTVHKWSDQPRMQIGIRNETRNPYRVIGVDGMKRWMNTMQWFIDRGFVDEIGPYGKAWRGCDALFTKRR